MRTRVKGWSPWRAWRVWSHDYDDEEDKDNEHAEDDEDEDHEHDEDVGLEGLESRHRFTTLETTLAFRFELTFWVLVTGVDGEIILYHDTFILLKRYATAESEHLLTTDVAMYLGRLRDTASAELKTTVSDIVIAVPGWFTDVQRRAILDAASIANLNVPRIINDTTAVAFGSRFR
ncbi:Hsp70 protein-domain-containing protein [Lentinula aff. detonsa]|uniref:Hsp70 protein-domain-containing protein n=1 Tax=Lentinula aff. detonsa TaxID=2804958 RepID=A0AA38NB44_9AGAR|nr:Hsp70 protein-domain-containing protein [Lentinula aff. detonsa]KAJ3792270.1 Hsp70 protein-domain-containing protein [Lentinula aff. detonsa]